MEAQSELSGPDNCCASLRFGAVDEVPVRNLHQQRLLTGLQLRRVGHRVMVISTVCHQRPNPYSMPGESISSWLHGTGFPFFSWTAIF